MSSASRSSPFYLALSGGVGGAKLVAGLAEILPPSDLLIVGNTGDDFEHLGFHISPDLDSLTYALSKLNDEERGWGRRDETWHFLEAFGELGGETWFQLGDRDLAIHVARTLGLRSGQTLSQVTSSIARHLGIQHKIVPMSDDPVRTVIETDDCALEFQDYFVRRRCQPQIKGITFAGASAARMQKDFRAALSDPALSGVIVCPSNPYISVDPILAVSEVREALTVCAVPIIAVSPIIGGRALKGPAAKMMAELGHAPSVATFARHYQGLAQGIIIDVCDRAAAEDIAELGFQVVATHTVMSSTTDRVALARAALDLAQSLGGSREPVTEKAIT